MSAARAAASAGRFLKWRALPAAGLAGGALWVDDQCHHVAQRTMRALGTGLYMLWEYKVRWTPEKSSEVHQRVARRLVDCLKKNEGLYVKFGQALASMDIVLPEEYRQALHVLHDQAATFSFNEVKRVVEAELGRPLDEIFSQFDEEPVASASIAQVHRARLKVNCLPAEERAYFPTEADDIAVAVKVQKPNIPAQNHWDLTAYRLVLEVFERSFDLPLAWTYAYTKRQLQAELDFRVEAANAARCAAEMEDNPRLCNRVAVPQVFHSVSGQRAMVMEWVDCVAPVSDKAALEKAGLDPVEVMRTATEVFGYQIFSTGHVHCDPHPGNLLVRVAQPKAVPTGGESNWQLVLLDHGLYCELPDQLRQQYADFWVATALGDRDAVVRLCRGWGVADEEASELLASLTQFRRVRLGAGRLGSIAALFGQNGKSAQFHAAPAPPSEVEQAQAVAESVSPDMAQSISQARRPTAQELAAAQVKLKARAKKLLADTRAFPQELIFVGRNLNMIRSANFSLGSAVNRVAILAECAAAGSATGKGALASKAWGTRQLALLRFHLTVRSVLMLDGLLRAYFSAMAQARRFGESLALLVPGLRVFLGQPC